MLHELLARLTQDAGGRPLAIALAVAAAGLLLWAAGTRVGRSVYTLAGVAVGAWAGLNLPRWCGWDIDAMAPAIGGALLVGSAGYLLHTIWVQLTLGSLLASAGTFIAWYRLADRAQWITVPAAVDPGATLTANVQHLWDALPPNMPWQIPSAAAGGLIVGALIVLAWPKLGRVLAFSLLGSTMLVGGAVIAMALARPQWLGRIPESTQTRGIALAILVLGGAVIQWMLSPRKPKPLEAEPDGKMVSDWRDGVPRVRDVRDLGQTSQGPGKLLKEVHA